MKNHLMLFFAIAITALSGCSLPQETIQKLESNPRSIVEFPVDYAISLPSQDFSQWDTDYNIYDRYLTPGIMRTQMGITAQINGVHTWVCNPSAMTHAQLDTATMIKDKKALIGEWRMVNQRLITFEDSASYAEKTIHRSSNLEKTWNEDDTYLSITEGKFMIYSKNKGQSEFKRVSKKNYDLESKRYLMIWGLSRGGAAISQVGIDKDGHLIINTSFVRERKIKDKYLVFRATISQLILERMND